MSRLRQLTEYAELSSRLKDFPSARAVYWKPVRLFASLRRATVRRCPILSGLGGSALVSATQR